MIARSGSVSCATCRQKVFPNPARLRKYFQLLEVLSHFGKLRDESEEEVANDQPPRPAGAVRFDLP